MMHGTFASGLERLCRAKLNGRRLHGVRTAGVSHGGMTGIMTVAIFRAHLQLLSTNTSDGLARMVASTCWAMCTNGPAACLGRTLTSIPTAGRHLRLVSDLVVILFVAVLGTTKPPQDRKSVV